MKMSRRDIIGSAAAAAAFTIVPRSVLGGPGNTAPSDKHHIAGVGSDGHERNWIRACKGGEPACSNFDYSGPLTETVVMGNLAILNPGKKLYWDGENMKVTNDEEANAYVNMPYREGWSL